MSDEISIPEINKRFLAVIAAKNYTPYKISKEVKDISQAKMTHIKSGRNKVSSEMITALISKFPDVNEKWLLTGEGFMFDNIESIDSNTQIVREDLSETYENKNGNTFVKLKSGKYRITVKKVPVKALGSYLSDFQNVNFYEDLEDVSFTVDKIGKGKYLCFESEGDSMNGGGIDDTPDGAELLCRELGRQHWKDGFRESQYGWVIVHNKTVVFKDLTNFNKETGDIVCHSRSGLPQHPDFQINLNDVLQIFKVIKRTF